MSITTTHELALADAAQSFPSLPSVVAWRQANIAPEQGLAFSVPRDEWPQGLGVDAELLVLVLPDELAPALPDLAASCLDVYNDLSADLLTCRTLLTLTSEGTSLEVDGWTCKFRPSVESGKFYVALVAADRFVLACHALGQEELDGFLCGWQAACISSGPNYNPYRRWSDEELEAAARGEDPLGFDDPDLDRCWRRPSRRVACVTVFVKEEEAG
jgi:hypothetical protein